MNQTVKYSISIDNQHCVDCANFKKLIETSQNMQNVLSCPWSRIVCLERDKYGMRKPTHVRIDFKLHAESSNYAYLQPSDILYIWEYSEYPIIAFAKNIKYTISMWMAGY